MHRCFATSFYAIQASSCRLKMFVFLVLFLVSLKHIPGAFSVTFDACSAVFNTTKDGSDCQNITVAIGDNMTIDSDLRTMTLCEKNRTKCYLPVLGYSENETNITQFTFCNDFRVFGELRLLGKKAISLRSCHGDIVINSTINRTRIHCTKSNGTRTNCLGTKSCDDNIGSSGGGGGGNGAAQKDLLSDCTSGKSLANKHHENHESTSILLGGNPGCYNNTVGAHGGGAIELLAPNGTIFIGSVIDASGAATPMCSPGGGGGTIRLSAKKVEITTSGKLIANGGDSTTFCRSGGGGGIINILYEDELRSSPSDTSVKGGNGWCPGSFGIVLIKRINGICQKYTFGSESGRGIYTLQKTKDKEYVSLECQHGPEGSVIKAHCAHPWNNTSEQWVITQQNSCWRKNVSISDIAKVNVTVANVENVTSQVLRLINGTKTLSSDVINDISNILGKIADIPDSVLDNSQAKEKFYKIVNDVLSVDEDNLTSSQSEYNSSNKIIEAVRRFSERFTAPADGTSKGINLANIAVNFSSIRSNRRSLTVTVKPTFLQVNRHPSSAPKGVENFTMDFILPSAVFNDSDANYTKVLIILYRKTGFFKKMTEDDNLRSIRKNYVISVSIVGEKRFTNLDPPFKLHYPLSDDDISRTCVYWDFEDKLDGWSTRGCEFVRTQTLDECRCNHLTNFAMLLDVEPEQNYALPLSIISYIGCSVSLFGIVMTMLTMFIFKELLARMSSKILLNICIALAAALAVFLVAAERRNLPSDMCCTVAGILNHYFFLSALSWMTLEAYTMYLSFVKYMPRATLEGTLPRLSICCLIFWGIPAIIVGITAYLALDSYHFGKYCVLSGIPMIGAFLAPVALCVVCNSLMYFRIMTALVKSGSKVTSTKRTTAIEQARRGVAISTLLGLTWVSGLFALRDAKVFFQYVFCIVNSLQGFFIFLFYCVFSTETRAKYRSLRCCKKTSSPRDNSVCHSSPGRDTKLDEIKKKTTSKSNDVSWINLSDSTSVENVGFSEQ